MEQCNYGLCHRPTLICDRGEGCPHIDRSAECPAKAIKYYFVSSMWAHETGPQFGTYGPQSCVIEGQHPFEHIDNLNKRPVNNGYTTELLSWQEITREEYELYKKLEL